MKNWKRSVTKLAWVCLVLIFCLPFGCSPATRVSLDLFEEAKTGGPEFQTVLDLYKKGQELKTFAARGKLVYERRHLGLEFISRRPDSLLLIFYAPTGQPVFRLVVDGGILSALDYQSQTFYTGEATAENLDRFLPLHLETGDLISLLTGSLIAAPVEIRTRHSGPEQELVMWTSKGQPWHLKLDTTGGQSIIKEAVLGLSGSGLNLVYDQYNLQPRVDAGEKDSSELFPGHIQASWSGRQLEIFYEQVSLGPELPGDLFIMTRPIDFEQQNL